MGDLADKVFQIFTPELEIEKPIIMRDHHDEILYVIHKYQIKGIEYNLNFMRREQNSRDYCYSCPYRLHWIVIYPNKSLTFKKYMKEYWVKNEG